MKNFFKYNRIAAAAALILSVILTLTFGVSRSTEKLAREVEALYEAADPVYGSAKADAKRFCTYLERLYAEASAYGIAAPEYLGELSGLASSAFPEKNMLGQAFSDADGTYNRLINLSEITEGAKTEAIRCFAEINAMRLRLKNNEIYNTAAKDYNKELGSFPAKLFDRTHLPAAVFE